EQRLLDSGVRRLERIVFPVEAAAALRDRSEGRQEDRPEERIVVALPEGRVRVREDRGGRLAPEILDRVARVGQPAQGRCLLRDERPDEGPVLVERGAVPGRVLLEREGQLGSALGRVRREAERTQGLVQVRSTDRHATALRDRGPVSYRGRGGARLAHARP